MTRFCRKLENPVNFDGYTYEGEDLANWLKGYKNRHPTYPGKTLKKEQIQDIKKQLPRRLRKILDAD